MAVKASDIITLARIDNGSTGPAGVGVSSITGEFYLSNSKTTQSGGSWVTTPPAWSFGKYLWIRYKIVYTNGSTTYTTPQCSSEWEAANDVQSDLDATKITIGQKVDQTAYDNDKAQIYDNIGDKLDTQTFNEMKALFDNLKQSYESFVSEGGTFEKELQSLEGRSAGLVKDLGAQLAKLDFVNTYMSAGEEGLLIGAKNSPMQMLLSKDSLSFMDGGQVVAYFSNQSFYINRGAVVESLQVGVHKLTKIDNYHTVIQYIPQ